MKHLLLFGAPNAGELMITLLLLIGIIFFVFKAGQWRGEAKNNRKNQ